MASDAPILNPESWPLNSAPLAVALSGGSDSMALALLLKAQLPSPVPLTALTVDHGLRPESAREAAQVGQWMEAHGIPHHVLRWEPPLESNTSVSHSSPAKRGREASRVSHPQDGESRQRDREGGDFSLTLPSPEGRGFRSSHRGRGEKGAHPSNLQERAREARYQLLTDWCRMHHATLCTAHTLEDQADTLLMRLQRGSGVDGLSGIPERQTLHGVAVLRPLLGTSREDLRNYLRGIGQGWLEDPSNDSPRYTRNRIRRTRALLEREGFTVERLAATATHLHRARTALEHYTEQALTDCVEWKPEGYALLNLPAFRALPDEIGLRLLDRVCCRFSGTLHGPRFEALERLWHALNPLPLGEGRVRETPYVDDSLTLPSPRGRGFSLHGLLFRPAPRAMGVEKTLILREPARVMHDLPIQPRETVEWDHRFSITLSPDAPSAPYRVGAAGVKATDRLPGSLTRTLPALKTLEAVLEIPHIQSSEFRIQSSEFLTIRAWPRQGERP
jgi:tRNA(Ile)-lysidine synthase TilS/MesJ